MKGSFNQIAGRFLSGLGILLLVIVTGLMVGGQYARYQTRQIQLSIIRDFENAYRTDLQDEDHVYTGARKNDYTAVEGATIAILRLDRLGIKVSIAEGTDRDVLRIAAGHFPGTAMPGNGNFSIAGHSSDEYVCLFNDIHKAVIGDEIIITTRERLHRYLVSDITVAGPEEVGYVGNTNESVITIVTCTESGTSRLIIRGIEI